MPHKRQNAVRIEQRRQQVAASYLAGKTIVVIAADLGCSKTTVGNDLQVLRRQWQEQANADTAEKVGEELEKLRLTEAAAWVEWERSKENSVAVTEGMDEEGKSFTRRVTRSQCGDPRFLDVILSSIGKRCRLLGLDHPSQFEITGRDGGPVELSPAARRIHEMSDEELAAYTAGLGAKRLEVDLASDS